jgi:ribosomal protein L20
MIWVQHDLYKNFLRSFNTGDINLSLDIFRSELSDLLTHKPNDFFSLLEKVKIKFNKKASYEELLDIVLREMKVNEKFVRGLAFIIGENNQVNKKNPKISWVKLLDGIKRGIEQIAVYFEQNPKQERLFRRKALDMVELKSSVIGDDNREIKKKDNTVLWILGITALGVAGYLIYRHFNKIEEAKLRAESLNIKETPKMELGGDLSVNQLLAKEAPKVNPLINDPSYNVSPDVLLPEMNNIPQMQNPNANIGNSNAGGIQIQVQPMNVPQQNIAPNVSSVQQNNVNI